MTNLFIRIEHEIAIENNINLWSEFQNFNNFKEIILIEFARNERVKRLIGKVHEFNEGVNKLENFLKKRDEISKNEEREEKK